MYQEFDPFSPDPNSESYLPDAESPRRSKLRLWIHGHSLKRISKYTTSGRARRRRSVRRGDIQAHRYADLAYLDLDRTSESTEQGEAPFVLVGWDDHLPGISEDDEIRHWTGETPSDPCYEQMNSDDPHMFSGSPRKWYNTFH